MNKSKKAQSCTEPQDHEWVVFSTALTEGWIMVQCVECGAHGTVDHSTKEEWSKAFYAPEEPYLWEDNSRVTLRSLDGDCFVEKYDPTSEADIETPMSPRDERWFRSIARHMDLTARKSNGLWHFYDQSNQLISDEVGLGEAESFNFLEEQFASHLSKLPCKTGMA